MKAIFKLFFISILAIYINLNSLEQNEKGYILYLMHSNEIEKAMNKYQEIYKNDGHDFEILQKMSLILLKNGAKNEDNQIQQLSMLGAGLAASNASLEILEIGLDSPLIQTQQLSVHFISFLQDDNSSLALLKALKSDFLPVRMEALYSLAKRKHPHAIGQIESLMFRLPVFLKPYFPSIFALIGTEESKKYLIKFLNDQDANVRLETILSIANHSYDELLPLLRKRFPNSTTAEKEAICYTISTLKDTSCNEDLKKLAASPIENVSISASKALYFLGNEEAKNRIIELSKEENIFAVSTLGDINGSEEILYKLTKSQNKNVRLNAAIGLLKKKDIRAFEVIDNIVIKKEDIAFEPFAVGRTMMYFKIVPGALHRMKDSQFDPTISLQIREFILKEALELNEKDFLAFADKILSSNQNDIVPFLISLLENKPTEATIILLKKYSLSNNKFIKDYTNLSLYRLKVQGNYEEYISNWIKKENHIELIQLNLMGKDKEVTIEDITKEENTRLLIDMYSALAQMQDRKSLSIILNSILKTNPKNRYALAGLLIRATE